MQYPDFEARLKSGEMTIGDMRELGLFLIAAMQGVANYPDQAQLPSPQNSISSTVFLDDKSSLTLAAESDDRLVQMQLSEMTTDTASFQHMLRRLFLNFLASSSTAIDQQQPFGQLGIHVDESNGHGGTQSRTLEMDNLNDPDVIWFYQVLEYFLKGVIEE